MKTISIVIPCYNVEDKIKRCIDSLKCQTYRDFDAFLVDDGSKDHTASIIKAEIKNDHRFHYLYKENGGQASARNFGLQSSTSDLITFIDSDDYVKEQYIEKLALPFMNEDCDLSACYFERVYQDHSSINDFNEIDLQLSKYPAVWGKMFNLSTIKKQHLLFPEGLWYEDLAFFTLYMKESNKVKIIEESLYYYMQNPNSTMYTYSQKIFDIYTVIDLIENANLEYEKMEYMKIYHILVGTIFRASFKDNFSRNELINIYNYVRNKHPRWYKNNYLKTQLPLFYRLYLFALRMNCFHIIKCALIKFNKYLSL